LPKPPNTLPKKLALGKWAEHIAKIAGRATENLTTLKRPR
jgi:hypothetical protein